MLDTVLSTTALSLSAALSIPAAIFAAESIVGSMGRGKPVVTRVDKRASIAVLVPAHNEESGISKTLLSIKADMRTGDRLVVVADNCTDGTALLARAAGAEVIERNDESKRGKGFALHTGVVHLANYEPEIVVIIDADCFLAPGALDQLAGMVSATGRPVQARYLISSPSNARLDLAVREFAFVVKNRVRPLGMSKLGLPCQLTGSGMAFPWSVLSRANLFNDNLVEDMKLGLDLARSGHAPSFCDAALITSKFPYSQTGSSTQFRRWERGHLAMIRTALGALTERGVLANRGLLAMLLDVTVPPLALLVLLCGIALMLSAIVALAGLSTLPFVVSFANLLLVAAGTAAAWLIYGTKILPLRKLYGIPVYAMRKVGFYASTIRGDTVDGWIRTDRRRDD